MIPGKPSFILRKPGTAQFNAVQVPKGLAGKLEGGAPSPGMWMLAFRTREHAEKALKLIGEKDWQVEELAQDVYAADFNYFHPHKMVGLMVIDPDKDNPEWMTMEQLK